MFCTYSSKQVLPVNVGTKDLFFRLGIGYKDYHLVISQPPSNQLDLPASRHVALSYIECTNHNQHCKVVAGLDHIREYGLGLFGS